MDYDYKKPDRCPFTNFGKGMRNCVEEFCHWYDGQNKQCIIHTIADSLKVKGEQDD